MQTIIFIFIMLLSYIFISIFFIKIFKKTTKFSFIIFYIILYISSVYITAEFYNQILIYLRKKHTYIEVGHASIFSIQVWLFFEIISIFASLFFLIKFLIKIIKQKRV